MSNFFSEKQNKPCFDLGACSLNPSTYALNELLLNEIKQIAFYTVKLNQFGAQNLEILKRATRSLSVIIINTAFRFEDYKTLLLETKKDKEELKSVYLNCCKERRIKYELIEAEDFLNLITLSNCLSAGEKLIAEKQKAYNSKRLGFIELIIIFSKTTSIILEKLCQFGFFNPEWNLEILKFLNLTNRFEISIEKLKRKIGEFSNLAYEINKTLTEETEKRYGKRLEAEIPVEILEGKGVLASGSDLFELEQLLNSLKDTDINVYTNYALYEAFLYPEFRKFKNLKAYFGKENTELDFANFKGPIFITANFLEKLDYIHRGIIFTTKIVAPEKTVRIQNYDFSPLKNSLNSLQEFNLEDVKKEKSVLIKYNKEEILKTLDNTKGEICVILGEFGKEEFLKNINCEVISLKSPMDFALLSFIIENFNPNKLEIAFTRCFSITINFLLSIISKNVKKIYLAKCADSIANPHILNTLVENFNVELI